MVLCSVPISLHAMMACATAKAIPHLRFGTAAPFCTNATEASSAASFRHAAGLGTKHHVSQTNRNHRRPSLSPKRPRETVCLIAHQISGSHKCEAPSSVHYRMCPSNAVRGSLSLRRERGLCNGGGGGRATRGGGRTKAAAGGERGGERERGRKQALDGMGRDHYQTLGLPRDATKEQIKTKFRQLARKVRHYHILYRESRFVNQHKNGFGLSLSICRPPSSMLSCIDLPILFLCF